MPRGSVRVRLDIMEKDDFNSRFDRSPNWQEERFQWRPRKFLLIAAGFVAGVISTYFMLKVV